jgi:anti-sigma B factor antagonist
LPGRDPAWLLAQEGRWVATVDVSSSRFPGHVVVSLGGELDICAAGPLGRTLSAAAVSGSRIIVDLAELTFIDCAGLYALATARRVARVAGGELLLAAVSDPVARLLCLTGKTGELPSFASVSEAAGDAPRARTAVSLVPGQADGEASSDRARYVATDQAFTERRPA